jgi:hypothetical protein
MMEVTALFEQEFVQVEKTFLSVVRKSCKLLVPVANLSQQTSRSTLHYASSASPILS